MESSQISSFEIPSPMLIIFGGLPATGKRRLRENWRDKSVPLICELTRLSKPSAIPQR
jgi:hypothetical protein